MIGGRVLFVQSQGSQDELKELLARIGMQPEGFTDPKSFLQRLKDARPVACVFDLSFGDAPILLAMIKSVRSVLGARLPLLVLVAAADKGIGAQAVAAGASEVLEKPVGEDELLGSIAKRPIAAGSGAAAAPELPKLIGWFFDKVSPALAGLSDLIGGLGEVEAQVRFFEKELRPNADQFVAMVRAMRKSDEKIDLVQSIRLFGMRRTRNLLVAIRLSSVIGMPLVQWNPKGGGVTGDPGQVLKFANRTLDHFGEGSRNQLEAYNAGLVLDVLTALAEVAGDRKAAVRNYIEERYSVIIRGIDRSIAAGKKELSLALERHIVTTLLMREAGRAAIAMLNANYLEFRRRFDKKSILPPLQHVVELKSYSVSHNLMGALICQAAPGLGDAYQAVLFFDYPDLLGDLHGSADSINLIKVCQA